MRFILFSLIICSSFLYKSGFSQEDNNNSFKVFIAEHGLHCPNLGPKLKVNIKQIGGEIIYFDTKTSIMLVNIPSEDIEKSNKNYLEIIIQLTGFPDDLIKVEKLTSNQVIEFLEKIATDEK